MGLFGAKSHLFDVFKWWTPLSCVPELSVYFFSSSNHFKLSVVDTALWRLRCFDSSVTSLVIHTVLRSPRPIRKSNLRYIVDLTCLQNFRNISTEKTTANSALWKHQRAWLDRIGWPCNIKDIIVTSASNFFEWSQVRILFLYSVNASDPPKKNITEILFRPFSGR